MDTPSYELLTALFYKSPVQDQMPGTTTWGLTEYGYQMEATSEENMPLMSIRGSVLSYDGTAEDDNSSDKLQPATGGSASRDGSPEVEITSIRKRERKPATKEQKKSVRFAENPNDGQRSYGAPMGKSAGILKPTFATQATPPETQPFDPSLIDPRLRNIDTQATRPKTGPYGFNLNQLLFRPNIDPPYLQDLKSENTLAEKTAGDAKRKAQEQHDPVANKRSKSGNNESSARPQFHPRAKAANMAAPNSPQPDSKPCSLPEAPVPKWQPNTWGQGEYVQLALAADQSFPYRSYAQQVGRHPAEIAEVFRSLVLFPIMDASERSSPQVDNDNNNTAESLMAMRSENDHKLSSIIRKEDEEKLRDLKNQAMAEVGAELRANIEAELRTQLVKEGWVKFEAAKDRFTAIGRELDGTTKASDVSTDKGKQRIKSVEEAQKDLMLASEMLRKATRAEDRKIKMAEKEAKGLGGKKLGRPKKGDGKGKGADFI